MSRARPTLGSTHSRLGKRSRWIASRLAAAQRRCPVIESLEERALLAALATAPPGAFSSGAGLLDDLLDLLPAEIRDAIPEAAQQYLDRVDSGTIYQAFPGETNEVTVEGDLGNFVLLFGERAEVTVGRFGLPPALPPVGTQQELLDMLIPDFEIGIAIGGAAGPVVVEAGGEGGIDVSITGQQIREFIKQFFDLGDARSLVFNQTALLDLIPDLSNLIGVVDNIIDFNIADIFPTIEIDPIIDIDLPFGLPDIEIPPEISIDIGQFIRDAGIPTSLRDIIGVLPGPLSDALDLIVGAFDFLKNEFISDSIFISTLDGPDTVDFSSLTGIPVQVYGGSGGDTITPGGSSNVFDTIFDTLLDPLNPLDINILDGLFDNNPARIELFGESGGDTFVINPRFNSLDLHIDGGEGNDTLLVNGSSGNDIIEFVAGPNGRLEQIRYYVADPNGGVASNETQVVTLPPDTDGGTFTLTYQSPGGNTETTGPIDYDATGAGVQLALESLSLIDSGDVAVSGPAAGPWAVTFTGDLGNSNQRLLTGNGSALTQAGASVTVAQLTSGNPDRGVNQIQRVQLPPSPISSDPNESKYLTGGTFTLTFEDQAGVIQTTEPIPHNASSAVVREALEALSNLAVGDVSVSGASGGPYQVEFLGELALTNQELLTADGSLLTGGVRGEIQTATAGEAMVQEIELPGVLMGNTLGGTFTLEVNGSTTNPLSATATSTEIRAALAALPGVGEQKVMVTGPVGGPFEVILTGLGVQNGGVTANASQLSGNVDLNVANAAHTAANETLQLSINNAIGGTYTVTVNNGTIARTTGPIPHDASAAELHAALSNLGSVGGPENLIVEQTGASSYEITFTGDLSGVNLPPLLLNVGGLLGGGASAAVGVIANGAAGNNETNQITFSPGATGGTFTLSFDGETTAALPHNATAPQVRQALEALASLQPGQVAVTGGPGAWTVEFVGTLSAVNVPNLTGDGSHLIGGFTAGDIQITTNEPGVNEVQTLTFDQPATGGSYLIIGQESTSALPHNATAAQVDAALEALPSIGAGGVSVSGTPGNFTIEFTGNLAGTNVGQLVTFTSALRRGEPVLTEVEQQASLQNERQQLSLPSQASGGTFTLTFNSARVSVATEAGVGVNESQTVTLPDGTTGGDFTLQFGGASTGPIDASATAADVAAALAPLSSIAGAGNINVTGAAGGPWTIEFTGTLAGDNVPLIGADTSGLTGDFTTAPIPYNASVSQIETALQQLDSLGGAGADNVSVTAAGVQVVQNVRGRTNVNEVQSVALPSNAAGGDFTLSFNGQTTDPIAFDATAADVEAALEALANIDNVTVAGNPGGPYTIAFVGPLVGAIDQPLMTADSSNLGLAAGPWTIEFINDFGGAPFAEMEVDAAGLATSGRGNPTAVTTVSGGDGNAALASTKHFNTFVDIERLRIDTGSGDDRVIFTGVPTFPQGIFYNAEDGTDVLEIRSTSASPSFTAPAFPNDDGATVVADGQAIQFDSMEGGLTFDAGGMAAAASLSGNDGGNELRFAGVASGQATFAMDTQVTITLANFGAGSSVELLGGQGDDQISVALNGVVEFEELMLNGGGPAGADTVRFEGTAGNDAFTFTPGLDEESGTVEIDGATLDYIGMSGVTFVGLGGLDSLTVNEPQPGSHDAILFMPALGNGGSFHYTTQSGGPGTALVYPVVEFTSIETRTFNTGTGIDSLSIFAEDIPGANTSATVDGGAAGTLTAAFDDQVTQFIHDTTEGDFFTFEIESAVDDVTVAPGVGVEILVNTSLGSDTLIYQAIAGLISVDLEAGRIVQAGVGDVLFTSVETARIEGEDVQPGDIANSLTVIGSNLDDRFVYTPLAARGGRITQSDLETVLYFSDIGGDFTVAGGGLLGDEVVVVGSANRDTLTLDAVARTATVVNAAGVELKAVILGDDVELATLQGGAGSDNLLVIPAADLYVQVEGGSPGAAGDRLVVLDQGDGEVVRHHQGAALVNGSVYVGPLLPVVYDQIERVDILPLDPLTGQTGVAGEGRIVVFHYDQHEQNDSFLNPTELDDLGQSVFRANIDPAGLLDPFGLGFDLPGDEDWYRFTAPKIGSFRLEVIFDAVAGLPGGGELEIELYDEDMALVVAGSALTRGNLAGQEVEFEVDEDQEVYLRVRGATVDAINVYDVQLIEIDLVGPRVTSVQITDDPNTDDDESEFNLFANKGGDDNGGGRLEPTPLIHSITINLEDLITRPPGAQGFVYPALDVETASQPGHYQVVGDNYGIIPIQQVIVTNATPMVGTIPTATVELVFFEPLPDDRFTLTLSENILDPPGNQFDGESNALEPQDPPAFPSGDNQAGGAFEARFTVDSRAEVGVWAAGSVYVDTNGNGIHDPSTGDFTNRDITYTLGFTTDTIFAGNFYDSRVNTAADADGFHKLAGYGLVGDRFRWQIDVTNDGVPDLVVEDPLHLNGLPAAGDFDGNADNGDEVVLLTPTKWVFDLIGHDFQLDTQLSTNMAGYPIVGDFDGDGLDDLGSFTQDRFYLDLSSEGPGNTIGIPGQISGQADRIFRFGFPGPRDRPVAADMDGDGIDDIGLWVPDRGGATPFEGAEWYFLISADRSIVERIVDHPDLPGEFTVEFTPDPFGDDLFLKFGDDFAQPVIGNFDPPVTPLLAGGLPEPAVVDVYDGRFHNASNPHDVNLSGDVSLGDALVVVSELRRNGVQPLYNASALSIKADVNNDSLISLSDVLSVVSHLRNHHGAGEGEAEQPVLIVEASLMSPAESASEQPGAAPAAGYSDEGDSIDELDDAIAALAGEMAGLAADDRELAAAEVGVAAKASLEEALEEMAADW